MPTVLSVVGTRPEAIKMAPVIRELDKHADRIQSLVCVTGQHRNMVDQVLPLFNIQPDFDLNVMQPDQRLSKLTAALFSALDPILNKVKPDWVLAQGDTTTVLVAALASFYNRIPFGHVEAGLRTGNRNKPFPEEMNRRIADDLAHIFFAPTQRNRQVLLSEGCSDENIFVTGNTIIDALLTVVDLPYDWSAGPLSGLPEKKETVLITAHRRESFGGPLREICLAIRDLAIEFEALGIHFVYPVHMNPNVRKPVNELLSGLTNMSIIEPLSYLPLIHLMKRSVLVLTDSGGIQEEAPSLGVPVLVMRETTERPEGVEAGVAKLVGTNRSDIVREAGVLLKNRAARTAMSRIENPYGDGLASERIVKILMEKTTR